MRIINQTPRDAGEWRKFSATNNATCAVENDSTANTNTIHNKLFLLKLFLRSLI